MRQGLAAPRSTGAEAYCTLALAILAEALGNGSEQSEGGLHAWPEALAVVDRIGERFYESGTVSTQGE